MYKKKFNKFISLIYSRYVNNFFSISEDIFDENWYLKKYSKLIKNKKPFIFYKETGKFLGHSFHPLFDVEFYLNKYADIDELNINPVEHWIRFGCFEGRSPGPLFDAEWYNSTYPEVACLRIDPLRHFLVSGFSDCKNPNRLFDTAWYHEKYLKEDGHWKINPVVHYLLEGEEMGYWPHPNFDPQEYLQENPDVAAICSISPLAHCLQFGIKEGRYSEGLIPLRNIEEFQDAIGCVVESPGGNLKVLSCQLSSIPDYVSSESSRGENCASFIELENGAPRFMAGAKYPLTPFIADLRDVYAIAGSRYVLGDSSILSDEDYAFRSTNFHHLKYKNASLNKNGEIKLKVNVRQGFRIDCGINVMHEYSNNYFHFIAETMPRVILSSYGNIPKDIPLIFEENLHPNMKKLIDLINIERRPILYLENNYAYQVGRMYFPSNLSCVIDSYDGDHEFRGSRLAKYFIKEGVDRCLPSYPENQHPRRKIYLSRTGSYRNLLNQSEVEAALIDFGFEILKTEGLSIEAQIKIFQDASVIVGPTGANFANIVWCRPGAKVIVMASDHPSHQMYLWKQLGEVSECNVSFLYGERAFKIDGMYGVHDDFYIDCKKTLEFINGVT